MKKNVKKTIAMILSAVLAANGAMFSAYADETPEEKIVLPGEMPAPDPRDDRTWYDRTPCKSRDGQHPRSLHPCDLDRTRRNTDGRRSDRGM